MFKHLFPCGKDHGYQNSLRPQTARDDGNETLLHWKIKANSLTQKVVKNRLKWSMALLSPDPLYNWSKVKEISSIDKPDDYKNVFPSAINLAKVLSLSNWKIWVRFAKLPNRRISIGGKIIDGILMPPGKSFNWLIAREIFNWFSPCLEYDVVSALKLNQKCFDFKQNQLLNLFLESQNFISKLYYSIFKLTRF